jgi:hypothetical protein
LKGGYSSRIVGKVKEKGGRQRHAFRYSPFGSSGFKTGADKSIPNRAFSKLITTGSVISAFDGAEEVERVLGHSARLGAVS